MTYPVLDMDHLARYTGGSGALEAELFDLLRMQIDACVAALKSADSEESWAKAAHTLKGASRGVGAMALGAACAAAESQPLDEALVEALAEVAEATRMAMDAEQAKF